MPAAHRPKNKGQPRLPIIAKMLLRDPGRDMRGFLSSAGERHTSAERRFRRSTQNRRNRYSLLSHSARTIALTIGKDCQSVFVEPADRYFCRPSQVRLFATDW